MTHILTVHGNAQPISEARRGRQVVDAGSHRTVIIGLSGTAIFAAHCRRLPRVTRDSGFRARASEGRG